MTTQFCESSVYVCLPISPSCNPLQKLHNFYKYETCNCPKNKYWSENYAEQKVMMYSMFLRGQFLKDIEHDCITHIDTSNKMISIFA